MMKIQPFIIHFEPGATEEDTMIQLQRLKEHVQIHGYETLVVEIQSIDAFLR